MLDITLWDIKKDENKTIDELVLERVKLFNRIVEYEQKHIINNEPYETDEIVKPGPKEIYYMDNSYLRDLTDLIVRKSRKIHFEFYKKKDEDKVWWVEKSDTIGEHLFSFDKKKIYNLFRDYPHELTNEEKEIFDKENPYWVDFFKDRQQPQSNKTDSIPTCPICKNKLSFMMPDGKTLYCSNCNKYFVNNNGVAGEETGSPYTRKDVLY